MDKFDKMRLTLAITVACIELLTLIVLIVAIILKLGILQIISLVIMLLGAFSAVMGNLAINSVEIEECAKLYENINRGKQK